MSERIRTVYTEKAPAAIGPYSQAKVAGGFLFASGQIAIDPASGEIDGDDIRTQASRVLSNVGEILKAAGGDYADVVRTCCFLSDMGDFKDFNEVYEGFFKDKPARSCVAVKTLPKNVLCEVEVTAYLGER